LTLFARFVACVASRERGQGVAVGGDGDAEEGMLSLSEGRLEAMSLSESSTVAISITGMLGILLCKCSADFLFPPTWRQLSLVAPEMFAQASWLNGHISASFLPT